MFCLRCGTRNPDGATHCSFCGAPMTMPVFPIGASPPTPPVPPPPTSGLAIASLMLGILGLFVCVVPSLIGLVLGIAALVQIKRNSRTLCGQGVAVAGMAVSAFSLLVGLIVVAIAFPVFLQARGKSPAFFPGLLLRGEAQCRNNLRQIGTAMLMYTQDWHEHLPREENWCDAVMPYVNNTGLFQDLMELMENSNEDTNTVMPYVNNMGLFQCPLLPNEKCGYAYNARLSTVSMEEIDSPSETVLAFDAKGGWNRAGGPELAEPRHDGKVNVVFADGHTRRISMSDLESAVWEPRRERTRYGPPLSPFR